MCSPIQCLPSYKEPPTYIPCIPIRVKDKVRGSYHRYCHRKNFQGYPLTSRIPTDQDFNNFDCFCDSICQGPPCLPCGMDNWTVRRPLIVHDSTFDYRPTSWPGMVLNNQDKKVRYQLINYERPVKSHYPTCSPSYNSCC